MNERGRVLLADDDTTFLETAARLLQRAGYACDRVRNAGEAVQAVTTGPYDVVVADIHMEGNRELELVREIRQRFSDIPVILITGYPEVATAVEALRLDAVDYISKPSEVGELAERVDRAIKDRRGRPSFDRQLEQFKVVVDELRTIQANLASTGHPGATAAASGGAGAPGERQAGRATDDGLRGIVEQLSPREREILDAVASGQRVGSIARRFAISPYTVRNHLKAIFRKLGVHSQVELLARLHARSRAEHGTGPL